MNGGAEQGECRLRLCKAALKHTSMRSKGFTAAEGARVSMRGRAVNSG